jgi:hypothetical protein
MSNENSNPESQSLVAEHHMTVRNMLIDESKEAALRSQELLDRSREAIAETCAWPRQREDHPQASD